MRAAAGDGARFLAGGQSLVPMMSLRLAAPTDLVDLNAISQLSGISHSSTHVEVGAMTRQEDLVADELLRDQIPILQTVVDSVGHPGTRTRGTLGGSLCHADPAAELPALMLAVDAELVLRTAGERERRVAAEDFFDGYYETTIRPEELLTEVRIPVAQSRRMGFHEIAMRSADFAVAGAIVSARLDPDGVVDSMRVVAFALGDRPQRLRDVEAAAMAAAGDTSALARAAQLTEQLVDPIGEPQLSAAYRRQLGVVAVRRALEEALGAGP